MRQQDGQLKRSYNHYRKLASEYSGYLTRVVTKEPKMELAIHDTLVKTQEQILEKTLDLFDKQIQQALERPSSKSISSKHSKSSFSIQSRASAFSTQKRTKANAAQARVQFAMKESNMRYWTNGPLQSTDEKLNWKLTQPSQTSKGSCCSGSRFFLNGQQRIDF